MDVTDVVGGYGPWQRIILVIIVYRAVPLSFISTLPLFFVATTDHWCASPDNITWTVDEWRERAIPTENGRRSKCYQYYVFLNDTEDLVVDLNRTVACQKWDYGDEYGQTQTKEFNLVCSDGWKISLTHTLVKFGNLVGFIPAGYLTDKFGRKRTAVWSFIVLMILNTVLAFSPSYNFYITIRFFVGLMYSLAVTSSICMLLEVLGPDHRPKVSFSYIGGWGLGFMLIPGIYWLEPNWRHSQLIFTIPFTIFLLVPLWRFVPESIRWLLIANKDSEAEKIIVAAAKKNGIQLQSRNVYMSALKDKILKETTQSSTASYAELFKNKSIRKWTLAFYLLYFLLGIVYFGFTLTVQALGASLYLTVFLMGLTEVIAVAIFLYCARFRRKQSLLVLTIITSVCYLAAIPVPDGLLWLRLVLSMLGRLTNIVIYNLLWILSAEVFPTSHRSMGINGSMASGRIGTVLSTFLVSVAQAAGSGTWLLILFGVLMGLSGFLYLLLPQTKDMHLPDTMAATLALAKPKKIQSSTEDKLPDSV